MSEDVKPWYKSKTIWSSILTIALAAYAAAVPIFNLPPVEGELMASILSVLAAFGIYGRTTAKAKLTK